jgi:hypothetical protein
VTRDVSFAGSTVRVEYDGAEAARVIEFVFARLVAADGAPPHVTLTLRAGPPGGEYTLHDGDAQPYRGNSAGAVGRALLERLLYHLSDRSRDGLVIHAAAVSRGDECLLLPGGTGYGKTTLAAWLAGRGFHYLTDELVYIPSGSLDIVPFTRPLNIRNEALPVLGLSRPETDSPHVLAGPNITLLWPADAPAPPARPRLAELVFPRYRKGAAFEAVALSKAEAGLGVMACLINARNLDGHGFAEVTRVVREAPAVRVRYGDFGQLGPWMRYPPFRRRRSSAHLPGPAVTRTRKKKA